MHYIACKGETCYHFYEYKHTSHTHTHMRKYLHVNTCTYAHDTFSRGLN